MADTLVANPSSTMGNTGTPPNPCSAKTVHTRNTVAPVDPPVTSIIPTTSHELPDLDPVVWTDNICQICWLPVKGKRQTKPLDEKSKKKFWKNKKTQEQAEEYWLQLPCKHRFGSSCLREWTQTENEQYDQRQPNPRGHSHHQCPTCKAPYFYHTCHKQTSSKIMRTCRSVKKVFTSDTSSMCVRCELEQMYSIKRPDHAPWEGMFGSLAVGLVLKMTIPHNERYGYEPLTPLRQFILRHLPQGLLDSMHNVWRTRVIVGNSHDPKAVQVLYMGRPRPRKETRGERKERKRVEKSLRRTNRKRGIFLSVLNKSHFRSSTQRNS